MTAETAATAASGTAPQRLDLTSQQRFLQLIDPGTGAGPFGPRYTIVGGWRLTGPVDAAVLLAALGDVVERHDALRTTIVRAGEHAWQEVHTTARPDLTVLALGRVPQEHRDRKAEELLNRVEARELPMHRVPVLQAVLGRFDANDAVLVLAAHHTAVDGWSMQVIVRDLAACYAARRAGSGTGLSPVRQLRDYVHWQQRYAASPEVRTAREYWHRNLAGARVTPMRLDVPRSARLDDATAWYRYEAGEGVQAAVRTVARTHRSTPFMVLLAAYAYHLRELTGVEDVVVPTFTPGRRPAWTAEMVGSFFTMLPLRVRLQGCRTFPEAIARARAQCLEAYRHELPFPDILGQAPELMAAATDDEHAACTFQLVQSPFIAVGATVGDVGYRAMRRRVVSQPRGSQIPDGALWAVEFDDAGRTFGSVGYGRGQFSEDTVTNLVGGFNRTLARLLDQPAQR